MQEQKKFALHTVAALSVLSLFPIVGFFALGIWAGRRCTETTITTGQLDGAIVWRISRADCGGGTAPFYDVAVGAAGGALATAATSQGTPVPLEVRWLGVDRIGITLDRPWRGKSVVDIRLRRTGSPAERIDLSAPEG